MYSLTISLFPYSEFCARSPGKDPTAKSETRVLKPGDPN